MREKNRNSIEKCRKKLPQFTTMNVIDGQAGLTSYSSLIFYSLTIDNILNIIVLLILAGVTIATLTGDNGILTKATEASERTKQANAEEQVKIAVQASYGTDGKINMDTLNNELKKIDNLTYKGSPISDSNKITSLSDTVNVDGYDVTINGDGSVNIGDNNNGGDNTENTVDGVTIPDGFYYVGGSKEEGIVISDSAEDENKGTSWEVAKTLKGNQFVWVPVEDDSAFKTYEGYKNGDIDSKLENCKEPYENGYANEVDEYNAMKESVLEHNGFYVGRYEAGTTQERTSATGTSDPLQIKQNSNIYNWVTYTEARTLAQGMYTSTNYTSSLTSSYAWDTALKFLEQTGNTSYLTNSTQGNYYNTQHGGKSQTNANVLLTAGETQKVNNLYDLGGNVYEWTMETCYTNKRVVRGGYYYNAGAINPASDRDSYSPFRSYNYFGFRLALYVK